MFGYNNSKHRTLILASVLALTGSYAMAQTEDQAPADGDRPAPRQADGERGPRHGERGERGQRGERGERGHRGEDGERGRRGPRDHEAIAKRMFAGMELTDEQKEGIREAMKAHGEARKAWHEENKEAFEAQREKMREARGDKEAMEALREEMHALMESAPKPDATHDQIRALLNEEQQATFDERVEKMREHMQQRREGRGEGHGGPKGPNGHRRGGRLLSNLELDDDQKAKMREIMQSDQTRDEKMESVKGILNEEQLAKLAENTEKMRKYREEHKGERGERGDRPRRGQGEGGPRGDRPQRDGDNGGDEKLDL